MEQEGVYVGSRNLVICDREQEYAAAFAAYLLKKTGACITGTGVPEPGAGKAYSREK